jgi:hypothetical protein
VGRGEGLDGVAAAREAATEATAGDDPKLLLVFASDALDPRKVLDGVSAAAPGVPLIGCSTAGEISAQGPGDESVVVVGLGGPGFSAKTAVGKYASENLRSAGADAASCLSLLNGEHPHRVLIMLPDGLAGDQQEIVRGAYGVAGAGVPLVGGCAGDDMRMQQTHQLHGDEVLTDAVVAAALSSDGPIGIGVRHGWSRIGEPLLVTASDGNRVLELDKRPALDVYLDRLSAPPEARGDAAAFTRFAATHPLGLAGRRGEEMVRFVSAADFSDRAVECIAEVPSGAVAWFMDGDDDSVLEATDAACSDALDALGGSPPRGLIAFDCIARRGVLGDEGIDGEIERVAAHGDGAPVAGFYTYGEIARMRGIQGFHNQTLVVLAVG